MYVRWILVCCRGRWSHLRSSDLPFAFCACFGDPGAEESDVPGDPEAGSDGRGVVPQAEAGQHGGDGRQRSTDAGRRQ